MNPLSDPAAALLRLHVERMGRIDRNYASREIHPSGPESVLRMALTDHRPLRRIRAVGRSFSLDTGRLMRSLIFKAAALLLAIAPRADASTLYSTTDLGPGYKLETRPDGIAYGVANAGGNVIYAFDKSPVSDPMTGYDYNNIQGSYTLQNGSHEAGVSRIWLGEQFSYYPSFEPSFHGNWLTISNSPLMDINSGGQAVGTSDAYSNPDSLYTQWDRNGYSYAAFSGVNGQVGADASVANNLNNYIATIPGVTLTSAVKIDDLGRIIAEGSDGHNYLLTPVALGDPATVPEPSTSLILYFGCSWIRLRRACRKFR